MNEDRSTRYQRQRRQAALAGAALSAALLLVVTASGASFRLATWAVDVAGGSLPGAVILFVLPLVALHDLLQLPRAAFLGIVLERRYGLSRETMRQWMLDQGRAWLLRVLVLAAAAIAATTLRIAIPGWWWLAAGVLFAVTLFVFAHAAAAFLVPLTMTCAPLQRGNLGAKLVTLAERAGTEVLGVFEWQLSSRTIKANAVLTGVGRTRRILVSDTLLAEHSDEEVEVILAHELAHHVHHDLRTALGLRAAGLVAGTWLAHLVLGADPVLGNATVSSALAGLPVLALSVGTVEALLSPVANAMSRAHERRADRYALDLTRNPAAFVSALRKLAARNLTDDEPSRFVEAVFCTHPPAADRIAAATRWAGSAR